MIHEFLACAALALALCAARITLNRRGVFLLGRHGHRLAPAVLLSVWLGGLLLGQATHSLLGMGFVATLPLVALALVSRRHFQQLHARHRRWSRVDAVAFGYIALTVFFLNICDNNCHSAVVSEFLRGNVPPTAMNDPRFPLTYHASYDAIVALVMSALPVDLEVGMDLVTMGCVAITMTNLQTISRLLFPQPVIAQLSRLLFLFGFGPVFIRYFMEPRDFETMHGRTTQVFVDIILRRPTSLGFALFTLALAVLLSHFRGRSKAKSVPALPEPALAVLLPTCALIPLLSEEATLPIGILLLTLLVTRKLPWRWAAAMVVALAIGAAQSGVVRGVLGQASMATPHFHFSWPPAVPSWSHADDGIALPSREGFMFFLVELGPVFFAAVGLAFFGGNPRRRALLLPFTSALVLVLFTRLDGWPKADLDRFMFFTTPPVFMLAAAIVEWLCRAHVGKATPRVRAVGLSIGLTLFAGVPAVMFGTSRALDELRDTFRHHALGGDLRRSLNAVGPREPIITDVGHANSLVQAGFVVLGPMRSPSIGDVSGDGFDDYVRDHAHLARWLFLPENDDRLKGLPVVAKDGDHVLARAPAAAARPDSAAITANDTRR